MKIEEQDLFSCGHDLFLDTPTYRLALKKLKKF